MKITITTTVFNQGKKSQISENVQNSDLRIEMLKNVRGLFNTYRILDCVFDYECSTTKFGYRITKTIVQHKITKHTTVQKISYN
jgi:hypothetical protein